VAKKLCWSSGSFENVKLRGKTEHRLGIGEVLSYFTGLESGPLLSVLFGYLSIYGWGRNEDGPWRRNKSGEFK
jgi:hypothetical protein